MFDEPILCDAYGQSDAWLKVRVTCGGRLVLPSSTSGCRVEIN